MGKRKKVWTHETTTRYKLTAYNTVLCYSLVWPYLFFHFHKEKQKKQSGHVRLVLCIHAVILYSTKRSRAKAYAVFAWTANVFRCISKCFGTYGCCFVANAKVFLRILRWWPNRESFVLYSSLSLLGCFNSTLRKCCLWEHQVTI